MKQVSENFKNNIKQYGRQLDATISFDDTLIDREEINSVIISFNTSLFKTAMHSLEIDSNIEIQKDTLINTKIGVKFGDSDYEYINYNNYIVYSCEKQEDTDSYKIIAYDKMLESMIDYELDVSYPISVRDYLIAIFQKLNWSTSHIPENFINSNKQIETDIHSSINYTYRDVLDEIATITASFIYFDDGIPCLKYITDTEKTINEEDLSEENVTIKNKYFINSLVFGRAEKSDNIFRKDDKDIEINGLHEFKINDNQILSTNDRSNFIDELFDYLKALSFYTFDIKSIGIMYLDVSDMFNISVHGNTYKTILLNDETTIDQDIEEHLYTDEPEESETDYKYADETDKKINQTYILVDKQNQKITQQANQITEHEEKIAQVEQDVKSIKQKVENTLDYKREIEGVTEIHITDAGKADILKFEIKGNKTYEANLFPSEDLYPNESLQPNMEGSELI